jgi:ATP phosphoribosyltransferase regulatory subunit
MTSISSSGDDLSAREAQARAVRTSFETAGFEPVTTPVLQPAEIFLDRSGEDIRRRTYLFADPGGSELCLRPELTIPVCRLYLERDPLAQQPARLCSTGAVFRYQSEGSAKLNEFSQCGLEILGDVNDVASDAEVTRLGLAAIEAAGVKDYEIEFGDLSLFDALIDALDIPDGWKARLKRQFWRPDFFEDLLNRLSSGDVTNTEEKRDGLLSVLAGLDETEASVVLSDVLKLGGIAPVGGRGIDEIAARLLEKAGDANAEAMPKDAALLISRFMAVSGRPADAVSEIQALTKAAGVSISTALHRLVERLEALSKAGVNLNNAKFSTGFGRKLEYYTGHVFEVRVPSLGAEAVLAGGGRYDRLLETLGADRQVPAVGCAVALERLFLATKEGAGS